MSGREKQRGATALVVAVALAIVLAGQAVAPALVPASDATAQAGSTVGRAGFAYLTGFRVFAGAVLWNRLEPQFHDYYEGRPLDQQVQMLPVIKIITTLDPQFTQPYYLAPWILAQRGDIDGALELAEEGVRNNPRSGLLIASRAQVIAVFTDDVNQAATEAEGILDPDIEWADLIEQHDSYAILRAIYQQAGETEAAAAVSAQISEIDAEMERLGIYDNHDHDHDH